ncbi:hypothetical protein PIIN_02217 [Serendipita indica DSM 11827]|uniref:Elongin-C n=1 Tax=Serendipita indica (strain DSM 11827) TaxID=1109443 RepID=G4TAK8_SERID|nr:hypothetical protein PIIN_02217 [Serendipita indica DSM 11827]
MAEQSEEKQAPSEWVKIVSRNDGHTFIVPREVAMTSGFLRHTFDPEGGFMEGTQNVCILEERHVDSRAVAIIVEKVMEYLSHKHLYGKADAREEIPDFQERIPPDIALELLMAADFLESA